MDFVRISFVKLKFVHFWFEKLYMLLLVRILLIENTIMYCFVGKGNVYISFVRWNMKFGLITLLLLCSSNCMFLLVLKMDWTENVHTVFPVALLLKRIPTYVS